MVKAPRPGRNNGCGTYTSFFRPIAAARLGAQSAQTKNRLLPRSSVCSVPPPRVPVQGKPHPPKRIRKLGGPRSARGLLNHRGPLRLRLASTREVERRRDRSTDGAVAYRLAPIVALLVVLYSTQALPGRVVRRRWCDTVEAGERHTEKSFGQEPETASMLFAT